jgi:hypothetical protein
MGHIAPIVTHVAASQTDSSIGSGNSIIVYGIVVEGTAAGRVLVEQSDGSTLEMAISVPANETAVVDVPFRADNGIAITTPANVTCTVLHSQAGG